MSTGQKGLINAKTRSFSNTLFGSYLLNFMFLLSYARLGIKHMPAKLALDGKIILPFTVRTDGTQATYTLTQASITRENEPFTESRLVEALTSTFYLRYDCKSLDWSQQSAAVHRCIMTFKIPCNKRVKVLSTNFKKLVLNILSNVQAWEIIS